MQETRPKEAVVMKKLLDYMRPESKKKLIAGIIVSAILLALMFAFGVGGKKHMVLGAALCLGTGLLVAFRRLNFSQSLVCAILYLIVVPLRMFYRLELPINNLVYTKRSAIIISLVLIYVLYLFFYIVTQRIGASFGVTGIFLLVLTIAEYYVFTFREMAISFPDLFAIRTAISVSGEYNYTPSSELIYSVLWFAFFIALGFKINISPKSIKERFAGYRAVPVHIAASAAAAVIVFGFFYIIVKTPFLANHGVNDDSWAECRLNFTNGCLMYPFVELRAGKIDKPSDYSAERLLQIGGDYSDSFVSPREEKTERPNIILIMNEAFSDPRVLGDFETGQELMPFMDSLYTSERSIRGNLYMPVLGGLTVNSEFEVLTGNSMFFLSASSIPYETSINSPMPSLAKELEAIGYSSMAMHPHVRIAYGRDTTYENFGFDEFIDVNDFAVNIETVGAYPDDATNYREIIKRFESRDKDKPFFLFDVTIQNHSPYWKKVRDTKILSINGTSEDYGEKYSLEETYFDLLRKSDDAFKELVEYFETVDEPTIICMFGDHEAILSDDFYDAVFEGTGYSEQKKNELKYITPYVMVANYDADLESMGDFSANYLGAVLLNELGLPMSQFRKFQLQAMYTYPIMSVHELADARGVSVDKKDNIDSDILSTYKLFQYDMMFSKKSTDEVYVPESYESVKVSDADSKGGEWYDKFTAVTHALGTTGDGQLGTNSREAFIYNYKRGQRLFEADIQITSDGVAVIRHDWEQDLGQGLSLAGTDGTVRVPTAEEFLSKKIYGKYTPLTLEEWFELMDEYPDVWFITDSKYSGTVTEDFKLFRETAVNSGHADVLNRVIVQLYYPEMYDEVEAAGHFKHYILTLYMTGYPEDSSEMLKLLESDKVDALTMPEDYVINERVLSDIAGRENYKVFLHTVDDPEKAAELMQYVDGLYTDTLLEKQVRSMK